MKPLPEIIAENLRRLLEDKGWTEPELARRSGVSQRQVYNLLRGLTESPGLRKVEALARTLGTVPGLLMIEGIPVGILKSGELPALQMRYIQADPKGRGVISLVAEREASYRTGPPDDSD